MTPSPLLSGEKTKKLSSRKQIYKKNHPSFQEWKSACDCLTTNTFDKSTLLSYELLSDALATFLCNDKSELTTFNWIDNKPQPAFFTTALYQPHVQKITFNANDRVVMHGDIHGDIHSLNGFIAALNNQKYMQGFKIVDPRCYLLFLGDYTDRGKHGIEVLYTILRLKIENPDKVLLVRGNHEDLDINQAGGFLNELMSKFEKSEVVALFDQLAHVYHRLPIALYITTNNKEFALCCHGGIEWGYDPAQLLRDNHVRSAQWVTTLYRYSNVQHMPELKRAIERVMKTLPDSCACEYNDVTPLSACNMISNGFMWFDFCAQSDKELGFNPHRGWMLSADCAHQLMEKDKIRCVFRAHQHGDSEIMSRILNTKDQSHPDDVGIAKLWQDTRVPGALLPGMVLTFCVSPHNGFGKSYGYQFDAFGILHLAHAYEDWRLEMCRIDQHGNFFK